MPWLHSLSFSLKLIFPLNEKCLRNSEKDLLFNANIGKKTVNAMILFKYPNQLLPWYKTVPLKT